MLVISLILVVASLNVVSTDATLMKFSRNEHRLYAGTSIEQYAMYQELTDNDEPQVSALDSAGFHTLTPDCVSGGKPVDTMRKDDWIKYRGVRQAFDKLWGRTGNSPKKYTVTATFSAGEPRQFNVKKIDDNTILYASKYLPSTIAKVIISSDPEVAIFVNYNGDVIMKPFDCLYDNERKLVEGLKEINVNANTWFSSPDKALMKYLQSNPIDESEFTFFEQKYARSS